jgi:NTE family protein
MLHPAARKFGLVLTGGGARAAYQVGVLQTVSERLPDTCLPIVTGVSAGAINAAYLAAAPAPLGTAVRGLKTEWERLRSETIYGKGLGAWLHSAARWIRPGASSRPQAPPEGRAVFDTHALRAFLSDSIRFEGIEENLRSGRLLAAALTATSYETGRSVTFVDGAPEVPLWTRSHRVAVRTRLTLDHVMASSAIPLVFPAVRLNDGFYGDGSVRQTFPLSPAIHLGADRILAIATRPSQTAPGASALPPSPARALGLLLDSVFMDHLDADAEVLGRANRLIEAAGAGVEGLKPVELLMLRPSRDLESIAAEWSHRLPRTLRLAVQGLGGARPGSLGFLSYLAFDPEFTGRLIELGSADAKSHWALIERFLAPREPARAEAG